MRYLTIIAAMAVGFCSSAAAQPRLDLPDRKPIAPLPPLNEDVLVPSCRPAAPEEPACPGEDSEEYVVVVNRLACSGDCDLGDTVIRFANAARRDWRGAAGPRFEGGATEFVLKGYRFSGAGFYFEVLFEDESYVLTRPTSVASSPINTAQLGAVAVTFPSGKRATISWDYTIYAVRP